jgi:hypothetical protein
MRASANAAAAWAQSQSALRNEPVSPKSPLLSRNLFSMGNANEGLLTKQSLNCFGEGELHAWSDEIHANEMGRAV